MELGSDRRMEGNHSRFLADVKSQSYLFGQDVKVLWRQVGKGPEAGKEPLHRQPRAPACVRGTTGLAGSGAGYVQLYVHGQRSHEESTANCIASLMVQRRYR